MIRSDKNSHMFFKQTHHVRKNQLYPWEYIQDVSICSNVFMSFIFFTLSFIPYITYRGARRE